MNGYCNFITVAHCPTMPPMVSIGDANLGLVSAQPKSTRRTETAPGSVETTTKPGAIHVPLAG